VVESAATGQVLKKHIGGVKYEDISLECGYGMSDPFYNWMKDCFDRKASRKNGAIIACDFNYRELSRINFFNALITEIGMPALDATSKDAAKMTLKFTPEYTRLSRAAAGQKVIGLPISPKVQKQWLPANFRLRINDLEQATTRVNKIEALVIKQLMADNPTGTQRDYQKEPAHLEIPNLVFTVAEAYADQIYQWHEDFVIKGNCTDDKEKTGTLEFLAMDMTVLFTLSLDHLGIFKLTPDKAEANSDQIRRVKAELYCEDMAFKYTSAWS
jgi:phage tail-like protein